LREVLMFPADSKRRTGMSLISPFSKCYGIDLFALKSVSRCFATKKFCWCTVDLDVSLPPFHSSFVVAAAHSCTLFRYSLTCFNLFHHPWAVSKIYLNAQHSLLSVEQWAAEFNGAL